MSNVPPQQQPEKNVNSQFADVVLGVIFFALGGEFTVTGEQMKAYLQQTTGRQALTRQGNPDGSITFRVVECPQDAHAHDDGPIQ